jgi:hypothetical protein
MDNKSQIELRKFPYPFSAMLAISSDIDSCTLNNFRKIHKYINTKQIVHEEKGLGLDFSDSIWFYAKNSNLGTQLAFFQDFSEKLTNYSKELAFYNHSGWIDTIHSYGNFSSDNSFDRKMAEQVLKFVKKEKLKFPVWTNHGNDKNFQNIGKKKHMQGDNKEMEYYHSDMMLEMGVKYIWNQAPIDVFSFDDLLIETNLNDGNKIWSFPRFQASYVKSADELTNFDKYNCNYWDDKKIAVLWYPEALKLELAKKNLDELVEKQGYCIATQHLGYIYRTADFFDKNSVQALNLLAKYQDDGKILVARTSRVLDYNLANKYLDFEIYKSENLVFININGIDDPVFGYKKANLEDLRGITFYTEAPKNSFIAIRGKLVDEREITYNKSDGVAPSISIKWFEKDTNNYLRVYNYQKKLNKVYKIAN